MLDACIERQELSRLVSNAVQAVFKARKLYDWAKEAEIKDTTELQAKLTSAQNAALDAGTALSAHIEVHQCKNQQQSRESAAVLEAVLEEIHGFRCEVPGGGGTGPHKSVKRESV
ncbi:MAG: hypothetical protein JWO48_2418 [Bryobacterales bacterium]|nr:hypothetical protein [Bryobacterales bacterium]